MTSVSIAGRKNQWYENDTESHSALHVLYVRIRADTTIAPSMQHGAHPTF